MKNTLGKMLVVLVILISAAVGITYFYVARKDGKDNRDADKGEMVIEKPVIYFYAKEEDLHRPFMVMLDYEGELKCVYPAFNENNNAWIFTPMADGRLKVGDRTCNNLFWEGVSDKFEPDFTYSYCVKGSDTADFLWEQLHKRGLNDTESGDFISYWLPRMQDNAYNIIAFQGENYTDIAKIKTYPWPELTTQIRVFMAFKASDKELPLTNIPDIKTPERKSYTLVEWGGMEVTK